jgi:hypothetical protein
MIGGRRQLVGLDDARNPSFDHTIKVKTSGENYYFFGEPGEEFRYFIFVGGQALYIG